MTSGLNPSKRYTKEIAEKEATDLINDIFEALTKKKLDPESMVVILEEIADFSHKMNRTMNGCQDCRLSYSHKNKRVEGFCQKHQNLREAFQKRIDDILRN